MQAALASASDSVQLILGTSQPKQTMGVVTYLLLMQICYMLSKTRLSKGSVKQMMQTLLLSQLQTVIF